MKKLFLRKKWVKEAEDKQQIQLKNVYAQRSSGLILPEYRLPTGKLSGNMLLQHQQETENTIYTKGKKNILGKVNTLVLEKRQYRGDQLANFKQGKGDYGGIAGWSDDGADITNKVKSCSPNDFGLYDMAGNVAEWVADVYRPIVDDEANDFNYYRKCLHEK